MPSTSPASVSHLPSQKLLLRLAVVVIVFLALSAGYYKTVSENWYLNHQKILKHLNVRNTKEIISTQWERK